METDRIVTPGERVGDGKDFNAGLGVYEHDGVLSATLIGKLVQDPRAKEAAKPTLRVLSFKYGDAGVPLPGIGCTVTGHVVKVTPRAANVEIILLDGRPLRELFKGMIRQQDVRQTEVDKVELYKCFAPGDVILAQVISLGDRHNYFLSTAKNEFGVIYAKSRAGVPMVPINWQQMQCPATKTREFRKVAKQ